MKTIFLTNSDDQEILVNIDNMTHATPNADGGSIIYTTRTKPYDVIWVKESLDQIKALIK
ncbi:hypothetical protein [uncultured Draconibacterium sp.]|uniref:hypothetical protein n=1 Tax=uncultured Draconibacterium sp. TaxID=1573823 RepID=UPI0029C8732C|nr:hypothetical protein [uncultured Draconibacterium sp.]